MDSARTLTGRGPGLAANTSRISQAKVEHFLIVCECVVNPIKLYLDPGPSHFTQLPEHYQY